MKARSHTCLWFTCPPWACVGWTCVFPVAPDSPNQYASDWLKTLNDLWTENFRGSVSWEENSRRRSTKHLERMDFSSTDSWFYNHNCLKFGSVCTWWCHSVIHTKIWRVCRVIRLLNSQKLESKKNKIHCSYWEQKYRGKLLKNH